MPDLISDTTQGIIANTNVSAITTHDIIADTFVLAIITLNKSYLINLKKLDELDKPDELLL